MHVFFTSRGKKSHTTEKEDNKKKHNTNYSQRGEAKQTWWEGTQEIRLSKKSDWRFQEAQEQRPTMRSVPRKTITKIRLYKQ